MNIGATTLLLHVVATFLHFISATLLLVVAYDRGWLIANEWCTFASHMLGVILWARWAESKRPEETIDEWKIWEYTRRWSEYMITAGLLEVAILNTTDSSRITVILTLNFLLQLVGWLTEIVEYTFTLLFFGFVILGFEIGFISIWSSEPVHTKIIYAVLYTLFGVVQTLDKLHKLPFDPDHIYTLLSITTKLVLTWTIVAHDRNDPFLEWAVFTVAMVSLLWGGARLYIPLNGRSNRILPGT